MKSVSFVEGELVGAKTGEIDGGGVGESVGNAVLGGIVGAAEFEGTPDGPCDEVG